MSISRPAEVVQDQSTNNLHRRGLDIDGVPRALCNRRYRVSVYERDSSQASLIDQYVSWNSCPRCEAKHERTPAHQRPSSCHVCGAQPDATRRPRCGHDLTVLEAAAAADEHDRRALAAGTPTTEARYVAEHRPY